MALISHPNFIKSWQLKLCGWDIKIVFIIFVSSEVFLEYEFSILSYFLFTHLVILRQFSFLNSTKQTGGKYFFTILTLNT
jgi:hypothetical protein